MVPRASTSSGPGISCPLGLTEKMMTYALGRGLVISDQRHVEAMTAALKQNEYRIQAVIDAIVRAPIFKTR